MDQKTEQLQAALTQVAGQLPGLVADIRNHTISPEEQVEFGKLLVRLGELVQLHAWESRDLSL